MNFNKKDYVAFAILILIITMAFFMLFRHLKSDALCNKGIIITGTIEELVFTYHKNDMDGMNVEFYNIAIGFKLDDININKIVTITYSQVENMYPSGLRISQSIDLIVDANNPNDFMLLSECR